MGANKPELKLYYNSSKKRDRETLGYAETLDVALNERDISKNNLTGTQLAELADSLNIPLSDLMDKHDDYYLSELKDKDFNEEEMLTLMTHHPGLIRTPVVQLKDHTYFVESPFELIHEDLEIKGIKSSKGEPSESNDSEI